MDHLERIGKIVDEYLMELQLRGGAVEETKQVQLAWAELKSVWIVNRYKKEKKRNGR